TTALGGEAEGAGFLLATEAPQRSDLVPLQRVDRGRPVLQSADVQSTDAQFDLVPVEVAELARSEPVPDGQQDHGRIAVTVAPVLPGRLEQPIDLGLGQVLPVN